MFVAILLGLGVAALATGLAWGNLLTLAAPLGLWAAVVAGHVWKREATTTKTQRRARDAAAGRPTVLWRVSLTLLIWAAALTVVIPQIVSGPRLEASVAKEMEQVASLVRRGYLREALALLESMEIPEEYPLRQAQRHHNRGVLLLQLGERREAASALKQAYSLDRANADACLLLGRIAAEDEEFSEALRWLRRAAEAEPGRGDVARLIATVESSRQNNE